MALTPERLRKMAMWASVSDPLGIADLFETAEDVKDFFSYKNCFVSSQVAAILAASLILGDKIEDVLKDIRSVLSHDDEY